MGGDAYWGEGGRVVSVLASRGTNSNVKPTFALTGDTGKLYMLFELDGTSYFFDAKDDCLHRITYPDNLAEIIGFVGNPDGGLSDLVYDDI